MNTVTIDKKKIALLRSDKGHYGDRFNRIVKLAKNYYELLTKFDGMIERGQQNNTEIFQCALACKLMMLTGIRIGNEDSASGYVSKRKDVGTISTYGLTTLKKSHVKKLKNKIVFEFIGKKGVAQKITITDSLTRQQIICALDNANDTLLYINDYSLRKFVKKYVGSDFIPKDFRTLRANIEAQLLLNNFSKSTKVTTKKQLKSECKQIAEHVSTVLGNTPAMAKRAYIDPKFWEYVEFKRCV